MTPEIAKRSCRLLRLPSWMQGQAHKVGLTCLAARGLGQQSINAHQIDRNGGHDMLHLRFVQAIIACASYPHSSYRLGKRSLDACSRLIRLSEHWGLLFLSPPLQGFMSRLWTHMQDPTGCRGFRALAADRTRSARLSGKNHFPSLPCLAPSGTGLPLGTGRFLGLPIELEMRHIKALACFGLPTIVREDRIDQCDAIALLAPHQQLSINVASIHDLFLRQELMLGEGF